MPDGDREDARRRLREKLRGIREGRASGGAPTPHVQSLAQRREQALMQVCGDDAGLLGVAHGLLAGGGSGTGPAAMRALAAAAASAAATSAPPPPRAGGGGESEDDEEAPPAQT